MKTGTAKKPHRRKVSESTQSREATDHEKDRFTVNQLPPVTIHKSASPREPMISIWSEDPAPVTPSMIGSMLNVKYLIWNVTPKDFGQMSLVR